MFYCMGDSQHIHQINKVIGENEKCVFYFTEKKHRDFLANPIHHAQGNRYLATLQDPRALSAEMRPVSGAGKLGCSGGGGLMRALTSTSQKSAGMCQA